MSHNVLLVVDPLSATSSEECWASTGFEVVTSVSVTVIVDHGLRMRASVIDQARNKLELQIAAIYVVEVGAWRRLANTL